MLIHERIIAKMSWSPERTAIVKGGERRTYGDLHKMTVWIHDAIVARTGTGDRVALLMAKGPTYVAAMLACMAAGRPYIPLDMSQPTPRSLAILADSCAALLITEDSAPEEFRSVIPCLDIGRTVEEAVAEPGNIGAGTIGRGPSRDDDLAYILYTSGSTGRPKGLPITHRNARAFVDWAAATFSLRESDTVAMLAPLHFDLSVFDVYVGLAAGARLLAVDTTDLRFPQALYKLLRREGVTVAYGVPTLLAALVRRSELPRHGLQSLRLLLYAGEPFKSGDLGALMRAVPTARIFNLYGPAETNVITYHEVEDPPPPGVDIPVGRPVTGADVILVDEDDPSRPTSGQGEIVIAGDMVFPGYLNLTERTAAALTPVAGHGDRVFYRTGDIGRLDDQGHLHLVGRRDGIVKVRGNRVELGEVEQVASTAPGVAEVAIVAEKDADGIARILAFVVPRAGAADISQTLTAWLRDRLPAYMMPERIHVMDRMPTTSTGKVARAGLLAMREAA